MKKGKIKIGTIGKVIHTNRLIKRVGLDTDTMIALVDNIETFSLFRPKIFNRKNVIFINYKIFSELLGYFMFNKKIKKYIAIRKIFSYLRRNNITLLKKKNTDLEEVNRNFENLKRYREKINNGAGDKDLLIISIYKSHNIDLIFSRNSFHFKPFCDYLKISFEKLQDDIDTMWREVYGWRRRR